MSEIDADHFAGFSVNHEIGEMSVANSQYILTDTQLGMGAAKVRFQGEESFRGRAHLEVGPSVMKIKMPHNIKL